MRTKHIATIFAVAVLALSVDASFSRERRTKHGGAADSLEVSATPAPAEEEEEVSTLLKEWAPVKVVHNIGIRGGYGMGSMRREPTRNNRNYAGLLNMGVTYRFDVPAQKYVGAITAELNWLQKGFAYETFSESGEVYSRKFSVIELPIMWQPYLPLSKGGSRFHLNAGPFVSYVIDGGTYESYTDDSNKETIEKGNYYYDPLRDNRFEYGVSFGAGFFIAVRRFGITLDFRYNIGLSDILKGVTKYAGNPFRSPVDQINVSLGLSFRL